MTTDTAQDVRVYSIGHSDHTLEEFLALLREHGITLVVDVRSQPYSQWAPQFNAGSLARAITDAGIRYVFMGDSLGGRPADPAFYDRGQEHPNYERLASSPEYLAAIERLLQLVENDRVAMMCSEGDYHKCHRSKLLTPTLLQRGVRVLHICADGVLVDAQAEPEQLTLF